MSDAYELTEVDSDNRSFWCELLKLLGLIDKTFDLLFKSRCKFVKNLYQYYSCILGLEVNYWSKNRDSRLEGQNGNFTHKSRKINSTSY